MRDKVSGEMSDIYTVGVVEWKRLKHLLVAGKGTQAASGLVRVFAEWKDQLKTESNKKCRGVDTFITIKEGVKY